MEHEFGSPFNPIVFWVKRREKRAKKGKSNGDEKGNVVLSVWQVYQKASARLRLNSLSLFQISSVAMASVEQPPKKRRLYETLSEAPDPPPSEAPPQQTLDDQQQIAVAPPPTPPPLSQDEILIRRRNKDEIRSVYECYKRIRICLSRKDAASMPDIEQTYLSLITASRG